MAEAAKAKKVTKPAVVKKAKAETTDKKRGAPSGPRAVPEGYIGINTLAQEIGKRPDAVRRKLRAKELQNGSDGRFWLWKDGSRELKQVREALAS